VLILGRADAIRVTAIPLPAFPQVRGP
jgi:hypothetical protein